MSIDSILGGYEAQASQQNVSKTSEDKDMFLKLLVTQLTHQDPMNPVEDKEFIAQLAQFTSVEELQKVNTSLDTMLSNADQNQLTSAVGLIGTRVVAKGDSIMKGQGDIPQYDDSGNVIKDDAGNIVTEKGPVADRFYYSSEYAVVEATLTIRNTNNVVVYTEALGPREAGNQYSFDWTGLNNYGMEADDGGYYIAVTGKDAEGQTQLFDTEVFGDVYSVENIGGEHYLHLVGGRTVKYVDVAMVGIATSSGGGSSSGGSSAEEGSTGDGDD